MTDLATTSQGGEAVSYEHGGDASAGDFGQSAAGRTPRNDFGAAGAAWGEDGGFDEAALEAAVEEAEPVDRYEDPALDPFGEGDTEEVEYEGKRYRIPRALKGAVMMHADYQRQTQALAQGRRALEGERAAFAQEAQARRAFDRRFSEEAGRYSTLSQQLAALERVDWQTLAASDPDEAQRLQQAYEQAHAEREALGRQIDFVQQQEALQAQHAFARSVDHCNAVLARDLPDWSPQTADALSAFGEQAFGFSPEELAAVIDPRMIKVLHLAMLGHEAQEQSREQAMRARRIAGGQRTAPAHTLRGRSGRFPATADTDDFSAFENLADERMRSRR